MALFLQVAFVNIFLIGLGLGWFKVEQWVANTFVVSVFGEIAGCALIVVKYLFPKAGTELFSILEMDLMCLAHQEGGSHWWVGAYEWPCQSEPMAAAVSA